MKLSLQEVGLDEFNRVRWEQIKILITYIELFRLLSQAFVLFKRLKEIMGSVISVFQYIMFSDLKTWIKHKALFIVLCVRKYFLDEL